jgi:hypothetical protein
VKDPWLAECIDTSTLQPIPNCNVQLASLQHVDGTGGHLAGTHLASTDLSVVGTMNPTTGTTDSLGRLVVEYTMPEPAGSVSFNLTCTCSGYPTATLPYSIASSLGGLVQLSNGPGYTAPVTTTNHSGGNYVLPGFGTELATVANNFDLSLGILDQLGWNLSIVSLTYTSESLPQGGLFDLSSAWSTPHRLHRKAQAPTSSRCQSTKELGSWRQSMRLASVRR